MTRNKRPFNIRAHGFTLIEIAIVLVIVGLLLGGLLMPLATQVENARRQETQRALEEIRDAIIGFAVINGRLPCPDSDNTPDGVEDRSGVANSCTALAGQLGVVPWVTLGVAGSDAWGNRFIYRIRGEFADDTDGAPAFPGAPTACTDTTAGVSFALCSGGNLNVADAAGAAVVSNVPAVLLSTGKNGSVVASALETENTDVDNNFVSATYSTATGSEFDDLTVWITTNILFNRMVAAGRLP